MTIAVANLTQDSLEQLYAVAADDKTRAGARKVADLVSELAGALNRLYADKVVAVDVVITDGSYDGVSEMIAGEADVSVGSIVRFSKSANTNDFTGNELLAAKGPALLLVGDVFIVDGADSIKFLGIQIDDSEAPRAFDSVGETRSDFVDL